MFFHHQLLQNQSKLQYAFDNLLPDTLILCSVNRILQLLNLAFPRSQSLREPVQLLSIIVSTFISL